MFKFEFYFNSKDNILHRDRNLKMSQQVTVVVQQPNQNNEWSFGLFGCFEDCGECLLACCVPCIPFGFNARDSDVCCQGCCGVFCGCLFFLCCPFWSYIAWCCCIRPNIRRKHGIPTNCCMDCLAVTFCPCCALVQERRQLAAGPPPAAQVIVTQNPVITQPGVVVTQNPVVTQPGVYASAPQEVNPPPYTEK